MGDCRLRKEGKTLFIDIGNVVMVAVWHYCRINAIAHRSSGNIRVL